MSRRSPRPSRAASEYLANALLRRHARSRADGALTQQQLRRKTRREIPSGLELPEVEAGSSATDDLLQIGRLTPLNPAMRRAYAMWVAGETTDAIASALGTSRASAARLVRKALVRCWFMGALTFRAFSARVVYRPPRHEATGYRSGARCEVCAAPLWDDYERPTCGSPRCGAVLRQRRMLDRRRWESKAGSGPR